MILNETKIDSIAEANTYEVYVDGLRGIAILMVIAFHTSVGLNSISYYPKFRFYAERLSHGVQLFFIISAFTLFRSTTIRNQNFEYSKLAFYIRRAFRILPLWWFAVILYLHYWVPEQSLNNIFATFFLYFGIFKHAAIICFIPVGWSLFVEETFYLFFPYFFKNINNFKHALIAYILSFIVATIWFAEYSRFLLTPAFAGFSPIGNYHAFFLGILLFYAKEQWFHDIQQSKITSKYLLIDLFAFIGFIGTFFYYPKYAVIGFIPLLLSAFFPTTIVGKLTRNKFLASFGKYSYTIYLFHMPLLSYLEPYREKYFNLIGIAKNSLEVQTLFWFIPIMLMSLAVGMVGGHLIEFPCVRLGKLIIKKLDLERLLPNRFQHTHRDADLKSHI